MHAISRRVLARLLVTVLALSLSGCGRGTIATSKLKDGEVVFRRSPFTTMKVTQNNGIRTLRFAPHYGAQSIYDTQRPERLVATYSRVAMVGLACLERPERILMIGLGGGSMVKYLHQQLPSSQIDAVELDPMVISVAQEFFDVRPERGLQLHCGDGRDFLVNSTLLYDLIFLDAYGESNIPHRLATQEFLEMVKSHLTASGLAVANVWGKESNRDYPAMVKTYAQVFGELHIIRTNPTSNRILLAFPGKPGLTVEELARRAGRVRGVGDLARAVQTGYEAAPVDPALVLRDHDETPSATP